MLYDKRATSLKDKLVAKDLEKERLADKAKREKEKGRSKVKSKKSK